MKLLISAQVVLEEVVECILGSLGDSSGKRMKKCIIAVHVGFGCGRR
jgi:hypothetical protein